MLPLSLLGPAWAAPCAVARTPVELQAVLEAASAAWAQADAPAFTRYLDDARAILPCVAEPLDAAAAARVHRAEGLAAFARRDGAAARRAFAAARAADPAITLSEDVAAPGSPLRAEWDTPAPPPAAARLPPPAAGELRLDGQASLLRPTERPVVFQAIDAQGRAESSAWLAPEAPVPAYAVAPRRAPVALWVGAGAAALGGGALLGLAYAADADYRAARTVDEADARRATVNGLTLGSAGLGVAALGLGVVAVAGSF